MRPVPVSEGLILSGSARSLFQASQQWATMSSSFSKMRFESQFCRRYCQMFSTGFSSGERGGSGRSVMFAGTTRWFVSAPDAPSPFDLQHMRRLPDAPPS